MPPESNKRIDSTLGIWKGKIRVSEDFDSPLPPEVLREFGIEEQADDPGSESN